MGAYICYTGNQVILWGMCRCSLIKHRHCHYRCRHCHRCCHCHHHSQYHHHHGHPHPHHQRHHQHRCHCHCSDCHRNHHGNHHLHHHMVHKEEMRQFIEINGTNIQCEKEVKLLGITIDEKLKFDKHLNIICKKATQQINVIYRFKAIFDLKERQIIYNTFILSKFNYCPIIQHLCGKTCTKKIEAVQERPL